MSLNITRADEPIEVGPSVVVVYGQPSLGKTSLAYSCERPILLDFDGGSHRTEFRGDSVQVRTWADVAQIEPRDLEPFKTVGVDTTGRMLDALTAHLIDANPKMGNGMGGPSMQGWGALKARFSDFVKMLRASGKDLILLAHVKEDKSGDDTVFRPDVQGGSLSELFKVADSVAYYRQVGKRRVLEFAPSDTWLGKDPAGLGSYEVPDLHTVPDAGAQLLAKIRAKIEANAAASAEVAAEIETHREAIAAVESPEDLTAYVETMNGMDEGTVKLTTRRLIADRGKALGFDWSKADACYVPPATDESEAA